MKTKRKSLEGSVDDSNSDNSDTSDSLTICYSPEGKRLEIDSDGAVIFDYSDPDSKTKILEDSTRIDPESTRITEGSKGSVILVPPKIFDPKSVEGDIISTEQEGVKRKYRIIGHLASGGMGHVYINKDEKGERCALKFTAVGQEHEDMIDKKLRKVHELQKEAEQKGQPCKNLVKIHYVGRGYNENKNEDLHIFITKLEEGKCLSKIVDEEYIKDIYDQKGQIKSLDTLKLMRHDLYFDSILKYIQDVNNGLKFLHKAGLVLLDLKLKNTLISRENGKRYGIIIDVDTVTPMGKKIEHLIGTLNVMCVDHLALHEPDHYWDVYSFAPFLFRALTGKNLFSTIDHVSGNEKDNILINQISQRYVLATRNPNAIINQDLEATFNLGENNEVSPQYNRLVLKEKRKGSRGLLPSDINPMVSKDIDYLYQFIMLPETVELDQAYKVFTIKKKPNFLKTYGDLIHLEDSQVNEILQMGNLSWIKDFNKFKLDNREINQAIDILNGSFKDAPKSSDKAIAYMIELFYREQTHSGFDNKQEKQVLKDIENKVPLYDIISKFGRNNGTSKKFFSFL